MFSQFIAYLKIIEQSMFEKEYLAAGIILSTNLVALAILFISGLIVSAFLTSVSLDLFAIIWNKLTPGQQWIELLAMFTGVAMVISLYKAANELEKKIDESFEKLKKQNEDNLAIILKKNEVIQNLEKELASYNPYKV